MNDGSNENLKLATSASPVPDNSASDLQELPIKRAANSTICLANIHSVISDLRLIIPGPDKRFLIEKPYQSGQEILRQTVHDLVEWITSGTGRLLNPRIPYPLNIASQKIIHQGLDLSASLDFLYKAAVFGILDEELEDSDLRNRIFEEWITFYPSFQELINETNGNVSVSKLKVLPSFTSEVKSSARNFAEKFDQLNWSKSVNENLKIRSDSELFHHLKNILQPPDLISKNPSVRRLFSRLCRISSNVNSAPVRDFMKSSLDDFFSAKEDSHYVSDIEDGIAAVAESICTETAPKCQDCPLKSVCNAYKKFVADALFLKLFMRSPSYLALGLSKTCRDGKECLLCSLDPVHHASNSRKRVTIYPTEQNLDRKQFFVCIVEDPESGDVLLLKDVSDSETRRLFRGELHLIKATSDEAFTVLHDALESKFSQRFSKIARAAGVDYVEKKTEELRVHYVYSVSIEKSSFKPDSGVWVSAGNIPSSGLDLTDWGLLQNYSYFSRLKNTEFVPEVGKEKSDMERLNILWEATIKRMGMQPYPG